MVQSGDRRPRILAGRGCPWPEVPRSHAEAYAAGLPKSDLKVIAGAGNSIVAERGGEAAALLRNFLS